VIWLREVPLPKISVIGLLDSLTPLLLMSPLSDLGSNVESSIVGINKAVFVMKLASIVDSDSIVANDGSLSSCSNSLFKDTEWIDNSVVMPRNTATSTLKVLNSKTTR
jgi:hypothetical protein